MKLYVKFEKPETIAEFLRLFYSKFGTFHCSLIASNTFYDKECTDLHCDKKFRSFDDLYLLIKTYYESTTIEELMFELLTIKILNPVIGKYYVPHLGTCLDMNKIRYIPYNIYNDNSFDFSKNMINSEYTWIELLKTLNIESMEQLKDFVESHK